MHDLSESHRRAIEQRLLSSPVARHMGFELQDARPGEVRLFLPFNPVNVTVGRIVHGGVLATLADVTAVASAVAGAQSLPAGTATSNLSLNFLAPANGHDLIASGRCLRAGKRQATVAVSIHDSNDVHCLEALATIAFLPVSPATDKAG